AAGIVVTRAASGVDLGHEVADQLLASPRALWVVTGVLGVLAIVPGLPFLPFVALAGAAGALAVSRGATADAADVDRGPDPASEAPPVLDALELEVGRDLVPLVDGRLGTGDLVARIGALRRQLAETIGFVAPPIHVRDNSALQPDAYAVLVKGVE